MNKHSAKMSVTAMQMEMPSMQMSGIALNTISKQVNTIFTYWNMKQLCATELSSVMNELVMLIC